MSEIAELTDRVDRLSKLIEQLTNAARVPPECRFIRMELIAEMLDRSISHVRQRIVCRPDFPKAIRLDGEGRPVWKMTDVVEWADSQRER